MSEAEQKSFAEWYSEDPKHSEAFVKVQELWSKLGPLEQDFDVDLADELLEEDAYPAGMRPAARASGWMRYAAVLVAVVSIGMFSYGNDLWIVANADAITSAGKQKRIELPDGSVAFLNTDSAIAFDYSKKERRVRLLKGEAYFNVRPNAQRPFRVQAHDGTAEAVGTAFAVRKLNGVVRVTVTDGKVAVRLPEDQKANAQPAPIVGADRRIEYNDGAVSKPLHKIDSEKVLAWRNGKIVFEDMEFSKAISELDRYIPGRIIVAGNVKNALPVNGIFPTEHPVTAVRAVAAVQGLSVTEVPGGFLLVLH